MNPSWDFFIAHSDSDTGIAELLFEKLEQRSKVFVDTKCIFPGNHWDTVLLEAQCSSYVIVLLISSDFENAFYFREEISRAIALSRASNCLVVPVYLDENNEKVPYGLNIIQGLYFSRLSIEEIAERLISSLIKVKNNNNLLQVSPTWFSQIPTQPPYFVGRDEEIYSIKEKFGINSQSKETNFQAISAIQGLPGVGKTAFATMIANDFEMHKLFPDGILWGSLGQTPNLISKICMWGEILNNDDLLSAGGIKQIVSILKKELHNKKMLIILDDVWDYEHVIPIKQSLGQYSSIVMTTRQPGLLNKLEIPLNNICLLPTLSAAQATNLMEFLANDVMKKHKNKCLKLLKDLGYLPLAIHIAASLLREEYKMGWGITDLINNLTKGSELLNAQLPVSLIDNKDYIPYTLRSLLNQSTDHLSDDLKLKFSKLAVFSPKPFSFNFEAIKAVWQVDDPKPFIRELVNRGLLEPSGSKRFQLHSILSLQAKFLINT